MNKRITAKLLALAMVIGMLPVASLATGSAAKIAGSADSASATAYKVNFDANGGTVYYVSQDVDGEKTWCEGNAYYICAKDTTLGTISGKSNLVYAVSSDADKPDFVGWAKTTNGEAVNTSSKLEDLSAANEFTLYAVYGRNSQGSRDNTPSAGTVVDLTDGKVTTEGKPEVEVKATVKDGKAEASVSLKDMTKLASAAASSKAEEILVTVTGADDAKEVTVKLPATGLTNVGKNTSADVKVETPVSSVVIPNEGLESLAAGAANVNVSVKQADDKSVTVAIDKDGKTVEKVTGGIKLLTAVENASDGTVAVLVDAEGKETVVTKSLLDGKTMITPLEAGATVKFVDKAKDFSDVAAGNWAAPAVAFATSHELFQGTSDTTFAPTTVMDRAMLVTVLHRLENLPEGESVKFEDVPEDTWYTEAVAWASANKIVEGTGNGFEPTAPVTREQIAVFMYRYAKTLGLNVDIKGDESSFVDKDAVSSWAADAMSWAVGTGIITGKDGAKLDPTASASRAEVATMLQRLVKVIVK